MTDDEKALFGRIVEELEAALEACYLEFGAGGRAENDAMIREAKRILGMD